jgi:hypothetical protein
MEITRAAVAGAFSRVAVAERAADPTHRGFHALVISRHRVARPALEFCDIQRGRR